MRQYTYEIKEMDEDEDFWFIGIIDFENGTYLIDDMLWLENAEDIDEAIKYYIEKFCRVNGYDTPYNYYLIDSSDIFEEKINKMIKYHYKIKEKDEERTWFIEIIAVNKETLIFDGEIIIKDVKDLSEGINYYVNRFCREEYDDNTDYEYLLINSYIMEERTVKND